MGKTLTGYLENKMKKQPASASAKAISEIGVFPVVVISDEEIESILDRLFGKEEKDADPEPIQPTESE